MLSNNKLLLLLQVPHDIDRNLEDLGDNGCRGQSEPLGQRDVGDMVTLIQLEPLERLVLAGVLHVVTSIVGEDGGVSGGEVKGASRGAADEYGSACVPF